MEFQFTIHAENEIKRRQLSIFQVKTVLENPQQVVPGYGGKKTYQSQIRFENDKMYLLRVVVDDSSNPYRVITAYRTTKISKYWREQ